MAKVLVEGRPGSGKTTLVQRVIGRLVEAGVTVSGFTTSEVRERGRRVGFLVEAIDGAREWLARVDFRGDVRVGRYGVDLDAFERVALPALDRSPGGVVVVDELGKMELASPAFREAVVRLMDGAGGVLATVHAANHPFTDALKTRPDVTLMRLTPANRDALVTEVAELLERRRT